MTPPLITLIIATYKGDRLAYLRESVTSALDQTWGPLEVIVVQDGEVSDDARAFLEEAATDPRLRLMQLPQTAGPACARNAGIAAAQGEFIGILDADDRALPDRLQRQWEYIQQAEADLVGSQYRLIDDSGTVIGEKRVPLTPGAVRNAVCYFNPIANSTVFARAEVLKRHPYRDVNALGTACFGEDYDLWVTLLLEGYTLANHPEFLVEFRAGGEFVGRRRGLRVFRADVRAKLRALRLFPFYQRPIRTVAGIVTSSARLAPRFALRSLYRIRNRMRFSSSQ